VIARPKQLPPEGDWRYWWILAGRGFGKTITAANWARREGLKEPIRFGLVAPTAAVARDTMVEGVTGLLAVFRDHELRDGDREKAWNRSLGELYLANGTIYKTFSSERPDRIAGSQHHKVWCEEVSLWLDANRRSTPDRPTTWTQVMLSTRLSDDPQICLTSTPRPNVLTRELAELLPPRMVQVRGSSFENRANLAESYWDEVVQPLLGSRVGRQEIEAEILLDVEGALWTLGQIEEGRIGEAPDLKRIVVAIDPNVTDTEDSDEAGVIVVGRGLDDKGYVLEDCTIHRGGPHAWAAAAVSALDRWQGDMIVAEKNNGGDMVKITLHTVDPNAPVKLVNASRGKLTRAEPISILYGGDPDGHNPVRVHHVGVFRQLEEEMTTWVPGQPSPNRMDALVWGLTELFIGPKRGGRVLNPNTIGRIPTAGSSMERGGGVAGY
jgi:phage terminase large subunit-like protein